MMAPAPRAYRPRPAVQILLVALLNLLGSAYALAAPTSLCSSVSPAPPGTCVIGGSVAVAQMQAACQSAPGSNPCATFRGVCGNASVSHYSLATIAQRLDTLIKQLPSASATSSCATTSAARQLANEMTDALIANDVYATSAQSYLPAFVQRIPNTDLSTLAPLGIRQASLLSDPATGFYASVYYDRYTAQYVIANRGTVISPFHPITTSKDLSTDVRQALGYPTPQYNVDAARLARALGGAHNVLLTGHSLGGGLAALEAYMTGDPAVTFDAAGLSLATMNQNGATPSASIINIDVAGEFLGQMQGHSLRSDFACALRGGLANIVQRTATLAILHTLASSYGIPYSQAMLPTTILPLAVGRQVPAPLTRWSSTQTNSESVIPPNTGTCLAQVYQEVVRYHAADQVVHALNYELTQLICKQGAP